MKLTNRGRNIKDNSRRTGAGADRVEARRQGARDRFKIMSLPEWAKANGLKPPFAPGTADKYGAYKARKSAEARALGIGL